MPKFTQQAMESQCITYNTLFALVAFFKTQNISMAYHQLQSYASPTLLPSVSSADNYIVFFDDPLPEEDAGYDQYTKLDALDIFQQKTAFNACNEADRDRSSANCLHRHVHYGTHRRKKVVHSYIIPPTVPEDSDDAPVACVNHLRGRGSFTKTKFQCNNQMQSKPKHYNSNSDHNRYSNSNDSYIIDNSADNGSNTNSENDIFCVILSFVASICRFIFYGER